MAVVIKSEAQKMLKRIFYALREIDLVEESWHIERDKCIRLIERYGNSKNKATYKKAQEAAITGDSIEDKLIDLDKRRKSILEQFRRVLWLYTGDERLSITIIALIKAGGDPEKTIITDKSRLDDAVAWWQDFCRQSMLMARERYIRSNNK